MNLAEHLIALSALGITSEIDRLRELVSGSSRVVATISERDAIVSPEAATKVFVIDASDDASVDGGSAGYFWIGDAWMKFYESESIDVDLTWEAIKDRPDIDSIAAVLAADIERISSGYTLYVDAKSGSDATGIGSSSAPFATIQKALDTATPSYCIIVRGACTYAENISIPSGKTSILIALEPKTKIHGSVTLNAGNASIKFKGGHIQGAISDASTGTLYFEDCNLSGSSYACTGSGYKQFTRCAGDEVSLTVGAAAVEVIDCTKFGAATVTYTTSALIVRNCGAIGPLTHGAGSLVLYNVLSISASDGVSLTSTAGLGVPPAYLSVVNCSTQQTNGTWGAINKSGDCAYEYSAVQTGSADVVLTGPVRFSRQNIGDVSGLSAELEALAIADLSNVSNTDFAAKATEANLGISHVAGLSDALDAKQDTLVSGEGIKTFNGQSLLGAGNISFSASGLPTGSWVTVDSRLPQPTVADGLLAQGATFNTANNPLLKVAFSTPTNTPVNPALVTGLPASISNARGILVPTGTAKVYFVQLFSPASVARIWISNDWGKTFSATSVDRSTAQAPSGAGYVGGKLVITTGNDQAKGYQFSYTSDDGATWGTFNHGYYSKMLPPLQLGPSLFVFLNNSTNYGVVTDGTSCSTGGLLTTEGYFLANLGCYNGTTYCVLQGSNMYTSSAAVANSWTARTLVATAYRLFAIGTKIIYISGSDSYVSTDQGATFTKNAGVVPFTTATQINITATENGALVPNDAGTAFAWTTDGVTYKTIDVGSLTLPTALKTVTGSGTFNYVQGTDGVLLFDGYSSLYPTTASIPTRTQSGNDRHYMVAG